MYKENTYIVTGCTGFVGNVLTKKLMSDNVNVIGFARSEKKVKQVFGDNAPKIVYGDISNKQDVEKLFEMANENTVVIHTVAKVSIGECSNDVMMKVTVEGTKNVVENCLRKKVKKLLHISSTSALPKTYNIYNKQEKYIPNPSMARKGYAKTKSMADEIVFKAYKENGLNASFLMFASVLGPGEYTKGHMAQMIIDYIEGKLPASVKGGYNDFDIRDVADVLPNIIENSKAGENYIFANKPNQINDVLNVVAKKLNLKKLKTLPLWVAYLGLPFLTLWSKITKKRLLYTSTALGILKDDTNFSIEKVKEEFGYSPRPLEQTVSDEIDFFIEQKMVKIKDVVNDNVDK